MLGRNVKAAKTAANKLKVSRMGNLLVRLAGKLVLLAPVCSRPTQSVEGSMPESMRNSVGPTSQARILAAHTHIKISKHMLTAAEAMGSESYKSLSGWCRAQSCYSKQS